MTAYFSIHNRKSETLACAFIFLCSVFYAAISYEDVYDLAKIVETEDAVGEFDETVFAKWKQEYAHPLVIGNQKGSDNEQNMRKVQREINSESEISNMHFGGSNRGNRNTKLFELTAHPVLKKPKLKPNPNQIIQESKYE